MCPEEEVSKLIRLNEVLPLEKEHIERTGWKLRQMAIKRFHKSSADYDLSNPEHVRTPETLYDSWEYMKTYLLDHDSENDPRHKNNRFTGYEIEGYVRDRTKSINKDWSLQGYGDVYARLHPTCVSQIEQFARYHISNDHENCELKGMHFAQQLNDRTLNERLKTLFAFYDKARSVGMTSTHPSGILQNEAEFRAYFFILQGENKVSNHNTFDHTGRPVQTIGKN